MNRLTLLVTSVAVTLGCERSHFEATSREASVATPQKTTKVSWVGALSSASAATGSSGSAVTDPAAPKSLRVTGEAHYFPETASVRNPRPLLLFLHGYGATGRVGYDALGLQELGRRHQVFILAPDGALDSKGRRFWNAHPACCNFEQQPIDHVLLLTELVAELKANYPVDASRVYVIGFSNGGFMAHRLACEWGERLAGIVSVAGAGPARNVECNAPTLLRVLELHGDADKTVLYEGGKLFDRPNATYGSARDTVESWAKRLGCKGRPIAGEPMDLVGTLGGAETDTLSYEGCPRGTVSLWTVHGGSHLLGNRASVLERAWLFLNSAPR